MTQKQGNNLVVVGFSCVRALRTKGEEEEGEIGLSEIRIF